MGLTVRPFRPDLNNKYVFLWLQVSPLYWPGSSVCNIRFLVFPLQGKNADTSLLVLTLCTLNKKFINDPKAQLSYEF